MIKSKKLKEFKNIKHGFFNSIGGVSSGIYKSLNCGLGSKDTKKNVIKNLKIVSKKIAIKKKIILLNQLHSNKIYFINKKPKNKLLGDGLITNTRGLAIGILTADCAPILLFDYKSKIIAAIHVGWKGAKSKIISSTINEMCKIGGKRSSILAAIGPCIGKNSYEVGEDLYEDFKNINLNYIKYFSSFKINKFLFNLPELILSQLVEEKINIKNISKCTNDTYTDEKKFFSHRRKIKTNSKSTGRMISAISII